MGSLREVDADEYALTPFSKALRQPIYRDAYPAMLVFPSLHHLGRSFLRNRPGD